MLTVDREELGFWRFWKRVRRGNQVKEPILIITHKDKPQNLQLDLQVLLAKAIERAIESGKKDDVRGLTPEEASIIIQVLKLSVILIMSATVYLLIIRNYKFEVSRDKDGNVVIKGEPTK